MKQVDIGIFLHRTVFSESSLITTFYTLENGLQKFVFQGAKKKSNSLFPINICEITYYRRPDSELGKLTQCDALHPLQSILSSPAKNIIAFFIADVLLHTLHTNEREQWIFDFLHQKILELDQADDLGQFPLQFLVEYCGYIGIQPSLDEEQPLYFNYHEGEFHSDYRLGEWMEEGANAKLLYDLFIGNTLPKANRKDVLEMLLHYYSAHIPRFDVSKSLDVIREVMYE